jgi:hypothetical protein
MNAPAHPAALRQSDQGAEHRGNPGLSVLPDETVADGQTPPRNPAGACVPDERGFETFVSGAGI